MAADLMNEIKSMEDKARKKAMKKAQVTLSDVKKDGVDFNVWYTLRSEKIPTHHMKEILWADFKSRGLSGNEAMEDYDKALEKYGIKLN